ncbi:MAG: GDSL-type esterase/lipase family protein [Pseudomonadota bacterium]
MKNQALLNTVAATAMLLCACANGTSVAQGANDDQVVSLDALENASDANNDLLDGLNYKLLGMPDEVRGGSVVLGWPSSGVAARFEGSQLLATINGNNDTYLDIEINDVLKTVRLNNGRFTYRLIDAAPGSYDVSVKLRTERPYRPVTFEGFVSEDGIISAPERAEIQLLVVGDDVSTGYGIEGEDQFCDYSRATQNANLSFASLTGEDLDADVAIVARSGRGVEKNWDNNPAPTMSVFYDRVMDNDVAAALGDIDAIIVQLGAIDISQSDLEPSFKTAYADLLATMREDHPDAEIVATWGPMGAGNRYDPTKTAITDVVAQRQSAGDTKISFIEFSNTEFGQLYGCNWHPSADTQRFMASRLTDHLAMRLNLDVDLDDLLLGG